MLVLIMTSVSNALVFNITAEPYAPIATFIGDFTPFDQVNT